MRAVSVARDEQLKEGMSRNFQVFDVLEFVAKLCLAMGGGDVAHTGQTCPELAKEGGFPTTSPRR